MMIRSLAAADSALMVAIPPLRTDLQLVQCLVLAASNFCPEADDLIPCRGSKLCPVMSSSLIIASEPLFLAMLHDSAADHLTAPLAPD